MELPAHLRQAALRQVCGQAGLTLQLSNNGSTGYRGVRFHSSRKSWPYQGVWRTGGKEVSLGYFATAEEAALCYAWTLEGQAAAAAPPEPPPMTAEEALRQAEAEGLTLLKSESSSTGYKGVTVYSASGRYKAEVRRGGKTVFLGRFTTPEEAALCYARTPEGQAAAAAPPPLTAEEVLRQAEAEGLTLLRSESSTGFKGVCFNSGNKSSKSKPYQAHVKRGGKEVHLGGFATAEEAALCYARTPEAQAAAAAPPALPPLTAEEALQQAETEGLTLLRSARSDSGYKCVTFNSKSHVAEVRRGGKLVYLGRFATAEEAALCYARSPEGQAAAAAPPEPPPMTAEEALRQAEAEGLTLLKSEISSTGYKGVSFNRSRSKNKPYQAKVRRGGRTVALGYFATPEEAALSYARSPEAQAAEAAPPEPPPLTAEEAVRQAEAEGLTLLQSQSGSTGFKGVVFDRRAKSKPHRAEVWRGGKTVFLGVFATPEEAALSYARSPEAQAAAAPPPAPPPPTAEEAVRQAEAEGLTLLRSQSGSTGFKGVSFRSGKSKPYQAHVQRRGKTMSLGCFATAEEAALHVARASVAQAAAPQPPPTSSRKRKVRSEEQPPDVPAEVVVILEGRFVEPTTESEIRR